MGRIKLCSVILESRDVLEGFNDVELGEEYPVGFNLDEFKNLWSYAKKLRYAEEHLGKPLGRGSSRVVYRVDNDKVLKLAKNKKGLAQNEAEIDWANDSYFDNILAHIFDYDTEKHLWVEMELELRTKKSDFKRLWDVDLDDLDTYLRNFYDRNNGRRASFHQDEEVKDKLDNNEEVMNLVDFMMNSDSQPGDLTKSNSWGLVKREGHETLALIDFGLTSSVYDNYYS